MSLRTRRALLLLVVSGLVVAIGVTMFLSRATSSSVAPVTSPSEPTAQHSAGGTASASPTAAPASAATPTPTRTPTPIPAPSKTPTPSTAPTLHVLALGDSVTAGSNCDCDAFPELYAHAIASSTGDTVKLSNQGEPGSTSSDVVTYLSSADGEKAVEQSDVVLLTIGANDFSEVAPKVLTQTCGGDDDLSCARAGLAGLALNMNAITARLQQLRGKQPTQVLITDYWNVFEDGDVADEDYSARGRKESDRLTTAVNAVIERAADKSTATFVDLYQPFRGAAGDQDPTDLLADDGDHPDAAGHKVIAQALVAAGLGSVATAKH